VLGNNQNCTSKDIYDRINKDLNKVGFTFDSYYDIPILWYYEENSE
jgi:hypothetical protein